MPQPKQQTITGLLILITGLFFVYAPMWHAGFIWDDDSYLTGNLLIRSLDGLIKLWTVPGSHPQYYPMVFTTYFLEYKLWGLSPTGYHIVNILLHGISCLLLWQLLKKIGLKGAWLAAMVFALHPVMVESVAWITERKNVLSLVFYLCGMLAGIRLLNLGSNKNPLQNKSQTTVTWGILLLCYVLALLSKTVTVSLPAALLVMAWWRYGRLSKRTVLLMLPLFVIGITLGLHTAHLEKVTVGAVGQDWDTSLLQRTLLAGQITWFYVGKLLYPEPLIFMYHRWAIDQTSLLQWLPTLAAIGVIGTLLVTCKKTGRGPLAAVFLFVGTLFPALGFFNVYPMRFSYVADHFQYHASLAMIVLVVCGLRQLLDRSSFQRPAVAAVIIMLASLGWITYERCFAYQDAKTLWLDTLVQNPNSSIALYNLGAMAIEDDQPANALALFNMAVIAHPNRPLPYYSRSAAYKALGQKQNYLADMRRTIKRFNGYEIERAQPHMILGNDAMTRKQWQEAANQSEQYIRCMPNRSAGYVMLGKACLPLEDHQRAITMLQKAIELGDSQASTWYNLGFAFQKQNQFKDAIACYTQSLAKKPKNPDTLTNLAGILAQSGQFQRALAYQHQALKITGHKSHLQNLVRMRIGYAKLLATQQQPQQALAQLQQVTRDAQPLGDPHFQKYINQLIATIESQR